MNRKFFSGLSVLMLVIALPATAQRHYTQADEGRTFSDGSRVVCRTVSTARDNNQVGGTIAGAVVGGLVGNQFGGGSGRTLATVAGAVGGGIAGNKIQENHQRNTGQTERVCERVYPRR